MVFKILISKTEIISCNPAPPETRFDGNVYFEFIDETSAFAIVNAPSAELATKIASQLINKHYDQSMISIVHTTPLVLN